MNKKIVLLLAFLLFCPIILADYGSEDITWNGFVKVYTDKTSFSDENITGAVYVNNLENYPLIGGRLVLQIAKGNYDYPSQFAKDNIVYEITIKDIWVLPNSQKELLFNLPKLEGNGEYRIDAYLWVLKSKMIGSSAILYSPTSTTFNLIGKEEGRVVIERDKTFFSKNAIGPIGFPVLPEDKYTGKVFIKNESNIEKKNLVLLVSICDWASAFCENLEKTKIEVESIKQGEEKEIDLELIAPTIPSAYEINLELISENKIESIYKNRVIVSGGTSKLRKIFMNGLSDENYSFEMTFTGSPDHFSNPAFENFNLDFELFNKGNKIEENKEMISKINYDELISKNILVESKDFDKACISITKNEIIYEQECFTIELNEIKKAYEVIHPKVVNVSWEYNEQNSLLEVLLKKEKINSRVIILVGEKTLFEEEILGEKNISKEYLTPKETLTLIVDDFDAKKQQVFEILLNEKTNLIEISEKLSDQQKIICQGIICQEGTVCSGAAYQLQEGNCCMTSCVSQTSFEKGLQEIPLILFIAIILLIISGFVIRSTLKKVKK